MATFTLDNTPYPDGTTVGAYVATGWSNFPHSGPPGDAIATATANERTVTFEGLELDTSYKAAGLVDGVWRYVQFRPEGDTAAVEAASNLGIHNVRDFLARPDGRNSTAGIQEASADGGLIWFPEPGEYLIDDSISITNPYTFFKGVPGAELVRSTEDIMLDFQGSIASEEINLTANVAVGDLILKLDTTKGGIVAGSYLILRANESTGAPSGSKYGERVQVAEILSPTELSLRSPTFGSYTTANTARVGKISPLAGVGSSNLIFTQPEGFSDDVEKGFVNFHYCLDPVLIDPVSEGHEEFAFQFDSCIGGRAVRPVLRDMVFDEPKEMYGYGILARGATQGLKVIDAVGESAQVFNTGGTSRGIPRHCEVTGRATGNRGPGSVAKSPFSLHSDCAFIDMDVKVDGWGDIGVQIKGTDHTIKAEVHGAMGLGAAFIAESPTIYPERVSLDIKVTDVQEFELNVGHGLAVQGVGHSILADIRDTDGANININRSGNNEPCSGTVISPGSKFRNWSRGNPSVYNAVRCGPTGVTDIDVGSSYFGAAPEGARAVRFEGGSAANTGCKLREPHGPFTPLYAESEYFALVGRGYVSHGSTAATARDNSFGQVLWDGTVTPTNARKGDDWRALTANGWSAAVEADTPISYWKFDETVGTVAADVKAANAGSCKNGVVLGDPGAIKGETTTCASLTSGSSQHILVPDSATLDYGDTVTYEAWVKRDNLGSNHVIMDKGSKAGLLKWNTANKLVFRKNGTADIVTSTIAVEDLFWHHVVVTKNGATVKLYIDGVDVTGAVTNQTLENNAIALTIGGADAGTGEFFNGDIDEAAIYGTALSAARVLAHYEAGIGKYVHKVKLDTEWVPVKP